MRLFHIYLQLILVIVLLTANESFSQEKEESTGPVEVEQYSDSNAAGDITYEKQKDLLAPYKYRRDKHGIIFSVGTEKYYPKNFLSLLDNVSIDKILKDEPINLFAIDIGYKYNFSLGSLALAYTFASGSGTGSFNNETRSIAFQRQTVSAGYYADNIFNEPWVVPYGTVGLSQFSLSEERYNATATLADDSAVTDPILSFKAGLLFQLNWIEAGIDSNTHAEGLRSSGLENTFLDVHFSWYQHIKDTFDINNPVQTADLDPDLNAEAQLGIGLKLEF